MKNEKTICPVCNSSRVECTDFKLRDSEELKVLKCCDCSLYFLSSFEHITDNFYDEGQMATITTDARRWLLKSKPDDKRRAAFLKNIIKNKKYLDFGCGAGGVLFYARKNSETYGVEKCESMKRFLQKKKLSVFKNIEEIDKKFDVITMFHVLEHLKNPKAELEHILEYLEPGGQLIIEVPSSDDALISLYKCRPFINFTHWTCHLYSFNKKSLSTLFKSIPNTKINYVKNVCRYGLANHAYWIFKGQKNGQNVWKFLNFWDFIYKPFLKLTNKNDTILISIGKK